MLVVVLGVAIWVFGWFFRVPHNRRWAAIAALWLVVVVENLLLPAEHPLRQATGGDARVWVVLAAAAGLALGYAVLVRRLKSKAIVVEPTQRPGFSDSELNRYARHILLRDIGGPGQRRLKDARVLVVGAGGLGSPTLLYLAAAGVGTIGVIDDDLVDASNLQRQIIHTDQGIGRPKVDSARAAMLALNPYIAVQAHRARFVGAGAADLVAGYDLVLDGSDNFDTRYLVNRICAQAGKPLISGAITQWEGQISLYDPARGAPCYECVFPVRPAPGTVPTCAEAGVAAPLPGVIGAMMAMEAVKHITGAGQTLAGRLLIHDALYSETRVITVFPRADCAICGAPHSEHRFTKGAKPGPASD